MSAALSVRHLTKLYGSQPAIDELSFDVAWGRVTGFLGPNGAGKTTTMRSLLGLIQPTSGSALVDGRAYRDLARPQATVGALLETQQFHPLRSARDHLRVFAATVPADSSRIDEVLGLVDLAGAADKKVGAFSLGMKQRLGLAAALLGDPRILILDEPGNGLDPAGLRWLRSFLRDFAAGGRSVFVSSHVLAEMSQMADEVCVIDRGRLVVQSRVSDLVAQADPTATVRTRDPERLRDLLVSSGATVELISHELMSVTGMSAEEVGLVAASAGLPLTGLEPGETDLEDIFLQLTGEPR